MKLVIKAANEGELETVATREYGTDDFVVPEPRNVVTLGATEEDEEETRYYVQNVVHQLGEDEAELHLVVQTEEEVMAQVRKQRAQQRQMQQMQKMAQQQAQGGGQGGNDSPFSL
jgi:hypothetical protein